MQHKNLLCQKCTDKEYEVGEIRVAGSLWTKILNVQKICFRFVFEMFLYRILQGPTIFTTLQMYLISLRKEIFVRRCTLSWQCLEIGN